jgi:hypothetical protein
MEIKPHAGRDIPMFEETMKQFESLSFLRDSRGRFQEKEVMAGWYQDSSSELYHYDGVVWDVVPQDRVQDLEFLGE